MEIVNINETAKFITKDTSQIREILSPRNSSLQKQSLAEATVFEGQSTDEHIHQTSEEIYYILQGHGRMTISDEEKDVRQGDGIPILPCTKHKIWNTGSEPLVFLCVCTPPYTHEDTVITE